MPKIQMIKRKDDSALYSLNLPKNTIEEIGWGKGDNIKIEKEGEKLVLSKEQVEEDDGSN